MRNFQLIAGGVEGMGLTLTPCEIVVDGVSMLSDGMVMVDTLGGVEFVHSGCDSSEMRLFIARLADKLIGIPAAHREMQVEHQFADGMYIRRMFIPKGTILVGKVHRKECINVVETGDIAILTETAAKRVRAGFTLLSPAGIQKVGYANADTIFTNIFRTDETNIAALEIEIASDRHDSERHSQAQLPTLIEKD